MVIKDTSLWHLQPGQRRKRLALALALAGMYCCSAGTVLALDDTNLTIGEDNYSSFDNIGLTHNITGNLILGNQETGNGTYTITDDVNGPASLNIVFAPDKNVGGDTTGFPNGYPNGALIVGNYGTGSFTQGTGSDTPNVTVAGDLILGHQGQGWGGGAADSVGTYTINSGLLTVDGNIGVGGASMATDADSNPLNIFTQNGGTVKITGIAQTNPDYVGVGTSDHAGALFVGGAAGGNNDGGAGAYIMNGGELNAGMIEVGHSGHGVMTQNGGTVSGSIWLGNAGGSDGSYTLYDGIVNSPWSIGIGLGGTGTFTQEGGTVNSTSVTIGWNNTGTFTQNAGDHNAHEVLLGTDVGGNGFYNLTGGTLTIQDGVTDRLVVGHNSQGSFNMTGGEIHINNNDTSLNAFVVGNHAGSVGTFTQSGGVVEGGRSLHIGMEGGTGTYNLNTGNSPVLNTGFITLGYSGTGIFNQQAGTTNNTGALFIGADDGTYNQFGGDLNDFNTVVGIFGTGKFIQSGGTHTTDALSLGQHAGSSGTYQLSGGDLIVNGQLIVGQGDTNFSPGLNGLVQQSNGTVTANQILIGGVVDYSDPSHPISNYGTGRYELSGGTVTSLWDTNVGLTSQGSVLQTGGTFNAGSLTLGSSGLFSQPDGSGGYNFYSSGIYDLQGGRLNTTGTTVAMFGLGKFNQSGTSQHIVTGNLVVGAGPGLIDGSGSGQVREGIYTLSGGDLTVTDDTIIGAGNNDHPSEPGGKGTFTQSGGTHTVNGNIILGEGGSQGNGNGTYDLSGDGTLIASGMSVGNGGTGTFTQSGNSSVTVKDAFTMYVGQEAGSTGTYTLNDGLLSVTTNEEKIGASGTGTFNQTGGTHEFFHVAMYIGDQPTGYGEYHLTGGTLVGDSIVLGEWGGTGRFFQNGTSDATIGNLVLARQENSTGTYELSGANSVLHVLGDEVVGGKGTGTFTQSAGLHTIDGLMTIGQVVGSTGTYDLQGGTLNDSLIIGDAGTGTFTNSGGTHNVTGDLILGNQSTGNGTYNLSDTGSLTVTGDTVVGAKGTGLFDQTGGTNNVTGSVTVGSNGTFNVAGGSLTAASMTNNGILNYSDGSLALGGGTGTLTNNTGGQVNFSGTGTRVVNGNLDNGGAVTLNTAAQVNVLNNNGGTINLNTNNLTVTNDYINTNFGVGNAFNSHANVTGSGKILATGDAAISLTGTGIVGGTSATPTLALGNVHVNTINNGTFNINNTGSTGPVIRGAIQNTGITNAAFDIAALNFGPIALSGSTAVSYDYNPTTAGSLTGQSFNVVTNFDNVANKTVSVTGAAYNLAAGNATPTPVTIANQRVGGTNSQALTVSNTAPSGDYTEGLNAGFGTNSGSATNNGGAIDLLVGGNSNSTAMTVGVNTASAGAKSGSVILNYVSDGSGTSGLGTTSVGSQIIDVNGNVYQAAMGTATPSPVQVANQRIGGSNTAALTVANTATGPTGFVEDLNASIGGVSGAASGSGSITGRLAGTNNTGAGAITVGVDTISAGAKTGTATLNYQTAGAVNGTSNGLGIAIAGSQDVTVNGNVYQVAQPSLASSNIILTNSHVGDTANQALSLTNTSLAPVGYQEALNASFSGTTGNANTTGAVGLLGQGATNNSSLVVGIDTSSAGAKSGTATLALQSDGTGTSGLSTLDLASQTVSVSGNVYNYAQSNTIAPINIVAHTGDGGGTVSQALSITNVSLGNNAFQEGLDSSFGGFTPGSGNSITPTLTGSITNLAAGATDNSSMKVAISTLSTGLFNGTLTVEQASNGLLTSGLGITSLTSQQVTATGQVTFGIFNYATPTVNTATPVDFGNVRQGSVVTNQAISISNTAPVSAFTEALNGSVVSMPASFTATGSFSGLQATSPATANTDIKVGMNTGTAGHQAGNVVLGFESDGTGIVGDNTKTTLSNQNVAVTGNVYRLASPTVNTQSVNLFARVGDTSPTAAVSLTNSSPDVYTEGLKASISTSSLSVFTAAGSIGNLAATYTDSSALQVGLKTTTAGSFSDTAALALASTGADTTGATDEGLLGQSVSLNGKVYQQAAAQVNTNPVDFGIVHVGDSVAAKNISVTNNAPVVALNDTLKGSISAATGPFTASGTFSGLAANTTDNSNLNASLSTATAGNFSGTATASFKSSNADMSDLALDPVQVVLKAQVNNYANPVFGKTSGSGILSQNSQDELQYTLNLGSIFKDSLAGTGTTVMELLNNVIGPADFAKGSFEIVSGGGFQLYGFESFTGLSTDNRITGLSVSFDTTTLGTFTEIIKLSSTGYNTSGYEGALADRTLTIFGTVLDNGQQPVPEPATMLLFGTGLAGLAAVGRRKRS